MNYDPANVYQPGAYDDNPPPTDAQAVYPTQDAGGDDGQGGYYPDAGGGGFQYDQYDASYPPPVPDIGNTNYTFSGNNNNAGGYYAGNDYEDPNGGTWAAPPRDAIVVMAPPPINPPNKRVAFSTFMRRHLTTIVLSVPFKLHIMLHFYAVYAIVVLLGYNILFATLFRMFSVPVNDVLPFWQTMAYFTILIVLHFFIASFLTLVMEYAKDFWYMTPSDTLLWGIEDKSVRHYWIYFVMYMMYAIVPFFWSICYTIYEDRNVLHFFQFFYFITMIICCWQIVSAWVWMYWRALVQKNRALRDRKKFYEQALEKGVVNETTGVVKMKWYQNPCVLKEYGMDVPSLNSMMFYTFSGFVLHILIAIVLEIDGDDETAKPSEWIGVGVAYFVCLWFLRESSTQKRGYRAGALSVIFLFTYSVLALAGCGASQGNLIGIWLVLMVATQGMCLRKRDFYAKEEPGQNESRPAVDSYLCCCKLLCRGKWFGPAETPEEMSITRRLRKERMSLWSDIKTLNNYLLVFSGALILLLIFGRQLRTTTSANIATRSGASSVVKMPHVMCSADLSPRITMVDAALMTALAYSDGDILDKDFGTWFSHFNTDVTRIHPRKVNTADDIGGSINAKWLDFYDIKTHTHFIVVRSFVTTTSWMRDIDLWGDSVVLQLLEIVVPFVSSWPDRFKVDFVDSVAFLKKMYGGANVTDALSDYVGAQLAKGNHSVVIMGHGTNGGLAKIVAAKHQVRAVAFNSPGTRYVGKKLGLPDNSRNEVSIAFEMSFLSLIDLPAGSSYNVQCPHSSETDCAGMIAMGHKVIELCGDPNGRGFK